MYGAAVVVVGVGVVLGTLGFRARRRRLLRGIERSGIVPGAPTDGRDRATFETESKGFRGPYG